MNQKNRKDLAHARAFTTVSTKHTAASHNSRKPILRAAHANHVDKGSSNLLIRGLTFESERQSSANTDVLIVQEVPSNFVSISKPSEAVERLMAKRQNAHENSLEEMRKELAAVHEECEKEIRERSTLIKIQIDSTLANIEEVRRRIQDSDLLRLTDKNLRNTWDSMKNLVTQQKRSIDEFHEYLRDVEHGRRPRVKGVMQKYYEIFHSISYISPFEIQTLLEREIQDYNKTVLSNFKVYENLHLIMSIQIDNWNKELENWLEDMKKRRRDAIASENFDQLIRRRERLEQTEEFFHYDPAGQFALKELSSKLNEIEEKIRNWESTIVIFDELSVSDCVKQLHDAVAELNVSGMNLLESYKSALQKVSDQYEKEVEFFKAVNRTGFWEEDMERLDRAVHSLRDCYKSVTHKLEDLWTRHFKAIQDSVDQFCSFLRDFIFIWKSQAANLGGLKEATGRFVDDLTAKSQKSVAELEQKAVAYSQQLREATNEDKMKQQLMQIFSTLDLICEKYNLAYKEECKAVEKYIENVFDEVPKIIEQFNKVIGSYNQNVIENSEERITTDLPNDDPGFIKQELRTCRNLVPEIVYWKTTILNEIMAFRDTFLGATQEAAQKWQATIFSQRSSVLQAKLAADSQRREDIKISIYDVRLQELVSHSKRLEDHKEEVNQVLSDASKRLDEFLQEQKQSIQKYESDIVQASEGLPAGRSTVAIQRLQKEVEKIREDYKIEQEQKAKGHREEFERILDFMSDKNDDFLNEIKVFKEGGNFSVEEAKSYRQSLILCSKTISKSKITNIQKMDKAFEELSKAIEKNYKTTVDRINTTSRELKFYEDAQKILTKCAVILERQVYRLLEDNTRFVNAVVDSIEESTKELCKNCNVEDFTNQSIQLLDSMDSRLDNLVIGFPIAKDNSANERVKPGRKISKGNQRRRQKSVQKGTINYRSLFIGSTENPPCETCFSTAAMNTMLKTIDEIQTEAMAFFSPTSKRRESEASYRDYMQQILHQLHCYRDQLENLWRQEIQEMLAAAEAFEQSTSDCILNSLNDFHKIHIDEMTSKKESKLRELKKAIKICSTRRNKMFDSLKVSHGHPERKESLAKLTEEIMEEEDEMQKDITDKLTEYEIELTELVNSYETLLGSEAEPLRKVLNKLEDRGKRLRLKELLDKRIRSSSTELTGTSYRLDLPETTNRCSFIYRNDSEFAKQNSFDIESVVNQFGESAREVYTSAINECKNEVNSFLEAGEEFKETWRRNIEIVAEVYEAIL